ARGIRGGMRPTRTILICLAALALLPAATASARPASAATAATSAHPTAPRAWLTTGDQANLLTEQPPAALGAPDPAAPTIAVDPGRTYQRIEGLGASITDSSAHLLAHSP